MGKKEQEFQIIEINRADDWCLPLWIGRQILQKMEASLDGNAETAIDDKETDGSVLQKKDLPDEDG
jgi:hypothetical protein